MDILERAFLHVLYSSLVASALAVALLFIKRVFSRRLGARLHHILWIPVLLRLLMPVAIESPTSLFNFFPDKALLYSERQDSGIFGLASFHYIRPDRSGIEADGYRNAAEAGKTDDHLALRDIRPDSRNSISGKVDKASFPPVLYIFSRIWLAGFLALALFYCVIAIGFKKRTGSSRRCMEPGIVLLAEQCKRNLKIKKSVPVYKGAYFKSPCISGVINPRIYLPEDIGSMVDDNQLRHILLHELGHYKRKDLLHSFFATLALLVHWFNPLIGYAVKKMKQDREIACDAYVMEILGEDGSIDYGMTILHLSGLLSNRHKQFNPVSFYETSHQLERRIKMIKRFKKGSYKISAIAVICCLAIGAATLTDAVGTQNATEGNHFNVTTDEKWEDTENAESGIKDKLVMIDPGHGGTDAGAVYSFENAAGSATLMEEKALNLEIGLLLREMLKKTGIRVEMTRQEDRGPELADRTGSANRLDASLFVSIHHNAAADRAENGTMTMFNPSADYTAYGVTGERAAQLLHEEMVKGLGISDGGLQERNNLAVLKNTKMPSVVVQVAYITNPSDREKLMAEAFKVKAAQALHDGIVKVLNEMVSAGSK